MNAVYRFFCGDKASQRAVVQMQAPPAVQNTVFLAFNLLDANDKAKFNRAKKQLEACPKFSIPEKIQREKNVVAVECEKRFPEYYYRLIVKEKGHVASIDIVGSDKALESALEALIATRLYTNNDFRALPGNLTEATQKMWDEISSTTASTR